MKNRELNQTKCEECKNAKENEYGITICRTRKYNERDHNRGRNLVIKNKIRVFIVGCMFGEKI